MKSLDETIMGLDICKNFSYCTHPQKGECPYLQKDNSCSQDDLYRDALHYLKEYQKKQKTLEIRASEYKRGFEQLGVEWSRIKDNPPLIWGELKQMEGKPVWIEGKIHKHWCIVEKVFYDNLLGKNFISLIFRNHKGKIDKYQRKESNMGETWNAYKKEKR